MAKISSSKTSSTMLVVACIAILVSTGLAQFKPAPPFFQIPGLLPPPVEGADKCWESLKSIAGCFREIEESLSHGQIGKIGPLCCSAINQVNDSCWPKMFPLNPFFPPLLKNFCVVPSPQVAARTNAASKVPLPILLNETEITECWNSITNTEGCALEIYKSLTNGQSFSGIGAACCKIVTEINDKCWPKMFPFNPFFPPLLKSTCAKVFVSTPAPKAV
ncbi:ECA1 gametogenesis related family protein [Melia azedarach]|uniref:ECA1 gametogenesis related family protein n=1 Tax=Melia azedarach TaxID=155640 RepID=A0ACC1X126_MELAZ|nr:ECA1 gametogenesis related family protein [Melia azedarach]